MRSAAFLFFVLFSMICSAQNQAATAVDTWLGQKLMLDFRYFCDDEIPSHQCRTPMTHLPKEIKSLLVKGRIGGVILFSENIENIEQLVTLNYQLQSLMAEHDLPPLFIAIDQEGGRVARIPDNIATRFVGNMAIGATGTTADTRYARDVASGLATAMKKLGFNVNFAPSVDVNVNPQNPVINVRSYGESPELVARLGQVTVAGLQAHNILSALKHFPGHGDTHVDSHTGLPQVAHSEDRINAVDLLPFKKILNSDDAPAMVMTAHIQYPGLDKTKAKTRDGTMQVVPATLSEKILTGVLRKQLGYRGLIVTDAMDMAGIAQFFAPRDALQKTFNAGADIALMPFIIRNKADIEKFMALRDYLLNQIKQGHLAVDKVKASAARIAQAKDRFKVGEFITLPLANRIATASKELPDTQSQRTEQALSDAAISVISGADFLPLSRKGRWRIVMPDTARCKAILTEIAALNPTIEAACKPLLQIPKTLPWQQWYKNDVLIIGDITPQHTAAEMGGLDDWKAIKQRAPLSQRHTFFRRLMTAARQGSARTVMVAMRAPYNLADYQQLSDVLLATFGYNVEVTQTGDARGAVFNTLVRTLTGQHKATGISPVTIELTPDSPARAQ